MLVLLLHAKQIALNDTKNQCLRPVFFSFQSVNNVTNRAQVSRSQAAAQRIPQHLAGELMQELVAVLQQPPLETFNTLDLVPVGCHGCRVDRSAIICVPPTTDLVEIF